MTAQGLTSSRPSRLAGGALLVAIVVLIALFLARPAGAATVTSPDAQWQPWALKWERIAYTQRRVVSRLHRQLGLKEPRKVPQPAAFIIWTDDPDGVGLQSWRLFGQTCKDLALWWRDVRIPDLRERLRHPGVTCSCPPP